MNRTPRFTKSKLAHGLGLMSLALGAVQVVAQPMLEEVIVTAQKREQSLQDVPISVSAYSGAVLRESGIKDVFDLQTNAPGLTVDQNQNATTSNFSIRGVGTGGNNFGQESSVGLYVDGVYRSRQSSMINQLVDIAAVEVLRGPQGTLFGRNTLSGAVQFNTVTPDHEGTAFLEATAGNYDLLNLSGAGSFSVIDDVLAVRLTGFSSTRDGWIENIAPSNTESDDIFDRDRWGWRAQALWTPNDDLTVRVILDDSEVEEICCGSTVWFDNNRPDMTTASGRLGSDSILEPRGATFIPESRIWDNEVAYNINPTSESEDSGVSVQVDYNIGDYTLTSVTAWRDFNSFDQIDADFTDLDALTDTNDAEQSQISQELRVTYTGEFWNYVAGAYYFQQDLDSVSTLRFGEDTEAIAGAFLGVPLDQIFMGTFFPPDGWASDLNEQEHESWAVFGQFDYVLTDSLTLTAGLRYSDESKELLTEYTESGDEPGFSQPEFAATQKRDDVFEEIDDDQTTGTIKLSYFMNNDTMFYASFGTGYKAGGTNTDRIDPRLEQVFGPETAESYEIGVKAEFPDQAVRLNVAIFMTDVDDFQVGTFTGAGFNLQNAATVETYGGEIELFWQATENLSLTAGYSKAVADFDEFEQGNCFNITPFRLGIPDPGGLFFNEDGSLRSAGPGDDPFSPDVCDRSGGRLGTNPEDFLALSARQEFRLSDSIAGFALAEYSYTGDMILDQSNEPLSEQDSYDLVNLRIGIMFESWDMELTAWGRNVLDEEYNGTAFPGVLQTGKQIAYRREPATWGLTLRKDF
jgi:iron complex outermembrane receptor protein